MAKDLYIPVTLRGNRLEAKATLGQTVIVTEGPETYTGPTTVTPTEAEQTLLTKDKLLTDNVTVNHIPSEYVDAKADYDNALTAFGVESDLADGISALTEYSNEITGEQDETLSDAVRTLADGYDDGSRAAGLIDGTFTGEYRNDAPMSGITDYKFQKTAGLTAVIFPNCTGTVGNRAFENSGIRKAILPNVEIIDSYAFNQCENLSEIDIRNVREIRGNAFRQNGTKTTPVIFLKPLTTTGSIMMSATEVRICQIPTSMHAKTWSYTSVTDMYVPWSEGEVSDIPWGAARCTVHYNTVFDSDGNIVS